MYRTSSSSVFQDTQKKKKNDYIHIRTVTYSTKPTKSRPGTQQASRFNHTQDVTYDPMRETLSSRV